jgi:ATP-dependent Lon protease
MEVIELPGYTENDKKIIAKCHLVPKQRENHGLKVEQASITDAAIAKIVQEFTREAGVRSLDRQIASLMRKAARRVASGGPDTRIEIDPEFVANALGAPPHLSETAERTTLPGVVVGLAYTSHGGDILFLESSVMPGGKEVRLRLTGQLGDVMKESAEAALSWVRSNAERLQLDGSRALEASEIHLHVPAGAVPKDGPSAGVAMVTALVSALANRRARGTVAMTGEISLRGRVLPIGGVKAKVLAAARAGIETVILPKRKQKDLVEIPPEILEKIELKLVEELDEVLEIALEPADD